MVDVYKKDGQVRICIDPRDLNLELVQEKFLLPTLDEVKYKLSYKKYFTVIDCKKGFWQIKLTDKSADLCTFNTPYGLYRFLRPPFGLNIGSEVYQRYMFTKNITKNIRKLLKNNIEFKWEIIHKEDLNKIIEVIKENMQLHAFDQTKDDDKDDYNETIHEICYKIEPNRLKNVIEETQKDEILKTIIKFVKFGWPKKTDNPLLKPYLKIKNDIFLENDEFLTYNDRIIIPESLRFLIIQKIQENNRNVEIKTHEIIPIPFYKLG